MKHNAAFMSNRDDWETPQAFFDYWDWEYQFDLDPAATPENAKCPLYFTKESDGLSQRWLGNVWLNPPYSHGIGKWIEKAWREVDVDNAEAVVCLIPARTDTSWWHDFVMKADHIWLIRGRMRFSGSPINAPFPSALVVFRKGNPYEHRPMFFTMDRILDELEAA